MPVELTQVMVPRMVRRHDGVVRHVARAITGFHQDEEGHWVAELECGHSRHVRHNPPWETREWVLTPEGRRRFLGARLECKACLEAGEQG